MGLNGRNSGFSQLALELFGHGGLCGFLRFMFCLHLLFVCDLDHHGDQDQQKSQFRQKFPPTDFVFTDMGIGMQFFLIFCPCIEFVLERLGHFFCVYL